MPIEYLDLGFCWQFRSTGRIMGRTKDCQWIHTKKNNQESSQLFDVHFDGMHLASFTVAEQYMACFNDALLNYTHPKVQYGKIMPVFLFYPKFYGSVLNYHIEHESLCITHNLGFTSKNCSFDRSSRDSGIETSKHTTKKTETKSNKHLLDRLHRKTALLRYCSSLATQQQRRRNQQCAIFKELWISINLLQFEDQNKIQQEQQEKQQKNTPTKAYELWFKKKTRVFLSSWVEHSRSNSHLQCLPCDSTTDFSRTGH